MGPKDGPIVWIAESPDKANRNVAIELYWQLGPGKDVRKHAILDLLDTLMAEQLFDALRTKQQIGYTVSCMARCTRLIQGFSIWLLSSKFTPADICRRVEAFLVDFRAWLEQMPTSDFERHVVSLAAQKLEPDRDLASVQSTVWEE